ncbi:hypothetical protein [Clostridium sp. 001]|uniref:hypothetical protein n=1 Tax=Clostridium sp. 001 TaxID=1970093 RepID=UPI001C2C2BD8|nr:hypothetical protein [Clostridium sp. 001]QXE19999.1 hypothetical protein B5S50_14860 [Clostridium sp. 001]
MLDIKNWFQTTELKVANELFLKPPPLPYIVFTESGDVGGADEKNCIANRAISIELYSERIDYVSESKIEALLNEKAISYKKDRTWIDSEKFFQTVYDFDLLEKF